jgi:hypothetical protein
VEARIMSRSAPKPLICCLFAVAMALALTVSIGAQQAAGPRFAGKPLDFLNHHGDVLARYDVRAYD